MEPTLNDRLDVAAAALTTATGRDGHDVAVVLGSGLSSYATRHGEATSVDVAELPGFPVPGAAGHSSLAYSTEMGTNQVLLLAGRAHVYEGYDVSEVVFPVQAAVRHGCHTIVLTNAAGGLGEGIGVGDLVAVTDHINLAGISPLRGIHDPRLGPRHPDMTDVYTPSLRELAAEAAASAGTELKEGVYAWCQGPMFETPAEIRMLQVIGADLVGMSTVPEATAARHLGAQVLAVSLCSNLAAGISAGRLTAEEVAEEGARAADRFGRLMDELLPRITDSRSQATHPRSASH